MSVKRDRICKGILFGCLVTKHHKRLGKGSAGMYATWTLCNMPVGTKSASYSTARPTTWNVLLFGGAYDAFHAMIVGDVFALQNLTILPPMKEMFQVGLHEGSGSRKSGYAMEVKDRNQLHLLGVCDEFRICELEYRMRLKCGRWFYGNGSDIFLAHAGDARSRTHVRMDLENALRPPLRGIAGSSLMSTSPTSKLLRGDSILDSQRAVRMLSSMRGSKMRAEDPSEANMAFEGEKQNLKRKQ